ncbi:FtsX-like permease family protein [Streptomyces sp. NPDC051940]|uniref:ABC transporter permease n=1 Tax=Streptomyces sp. NPDC051940 TaxID=3155675 RepID=UPI00342AEE96
MTALGKVVRAGVGRKRVQTAVMVLTTLLSVAASVLALGLLEASRAPFERAFARQHGAHLTAEFQGVTAAQARRTATVEGVSATAGPYPVAAVRIRPAGSGPAVFGAPSMTLAGRSAAHADVDDVSIVRGRWARQPGEIVLEAGSPFADLDPDGRVKAGDTELTVVGVAESVGGSADAWVVPDQLTALAAKPSYQMLYRFTDADSRADIKAHGKAVAAAAPEGSVAGTQSYLDVKQAAEESTGAFIPFVTAFALLGLAMSVLVIGIVVSGAVGAATRRIGILKSLGFTPPQIGRAYVAQALIPSAVGAALGTLLANVLAVPLMAEVAEAYGTGTLYIPAWVSAVVPLAVLALVAVTALGPALRAARLRTARVLGVGRATESARGRSVRNLLGRLPLPRSVTLGLAGPFARPARSATMAGAVAFGTLAVTFAVGLGSTLFAIQRDGDPDRGAEPVTVRTLRFDDPVAGAVPGPPVGGPPKPADPVRTAAVIEARPETASYYGITEFEARAPGLKGGVPVKAYTGDSASSKHTMMAGRWFEKKGEAVAASRFLQSTGKEIGDTVALADEGRTVRLTIVGEVFDLGDDAMSVRADQTSLAGLRPEEGMTDFTVAVVSGTDTTAFIKALDADLEPLGASAEPTEPSKSSVIVAMQGLIVTLTLMLITVAGLGVLNTVVLDTRDRVRDLGVFKALGMTPGQTVSQVLTQVAAIGLVAGAIGVPLGVALHGYVIPAMGDAVGTPVPSSHIDIYGTLQLALLALAGVGIAVAGALLPAGWAAKAATGRALRAE